MSLLIVGCGYVGQELVRRLRDPASGQAVWAGQPVWVLTRSQQKADYLRRLGVQPLIGHWRQPLSLPPAPKVTRVLVSVPHRVDEECELLEESHLHHVFGLNNIVSWLKTSDRNAYSWRLIYLSTTGVFGSSQSGESVDETTPVSPTRPGPQMAVAAEKWLVDQGPAGSSVVVRLAGIYGPGRVPLLATLKAGKPLEVPRHGLLNLIHVSDAAQAVQWLLQAENPRSLYLLSDGHPVERERFYGYLAEQCNVEAPQFVEPTGDNFRARRSTDKRVDSSRFWLDSGLKLEYPSYQDGLKSIL